MSLQYADLTYFIQHKGSKDLFDHCCTKIHLVSFPVKIFLMHHLEFWGSYINVSNHI